MAEHEAERTGTPQPAGEHSVAELVDALFTSNTKPDGREFTYTEVAAALREQYGKPVDSSHFGKIRAGLVKNPSRETLLMLCQFFKVPAAYFFPELERDMPNEERIRIQLREALRAAGLSPQARAHLEGMIDLLRRQREST